MTPKWKKNPDQTLIYLNLRLIYFAEIALWGEGWIISVDDLDDIIEGHLWFDILPHPG